MARESKAGGVQSMSEVRRQVAKTALFLSPVFPINPQTLNPKTQAVCIYIRFGRFTCLTPKSSFLIISKSKSKSKRPRRLVSR